MTMIPAGGVHGEVVRRMVEESQKHEAFDDGHLRDLFAGRSEAVVYRTIAVVTAGAASIFTEVANSVQTISFTEAEQLLGEHRGLSSHGDEKAVTAE